MLLMLANGRKIAGAIFRQLHSKKIACNSVEFIGGNVYAIPAIDTIID